VRALEELKQAGLWACAVAASPTAKPIGSLDLRGPLALVVGAEGEGVRPLVARTCDMHAVIPMHATGVGSLNASVAAGVALYEVARQRAAGPR
jgi:23S rRNA (guanosine2251-2'-O)-methyltransferase